MISPFVRTQRIIGADALSRLASAHVAIFGVGGVGGYVAEGLARSGVGEIDLIDSDTVCLTNLNRQIVALTSTIGQPKVEVMARRIRDINPSCQVRTHQMFYLPATKDALDLAAFDYIVDAVDTVTAKLLLIEQAHACGTPIISSMGAGNKLDPAAFQVADISKTEVDPLAKIIRKELRKRGITHTKVVFSKEPAIKPAAAEPDGESNGGQVASRSGNSGGQAASRSGVPATVTPTASEPSDGEPSGDETPAPRDLSLECPYREQCPEDVRKNCDDGSTSPGSSPFVPPAVGMIIASEVVKDLAGIQR
jgi:tRNA A37 threonylcarbamoyladenosine dehydratase